MAQPVDVEVGSKVLAPVEREKDEGTIRTTRYFPPFLWCWTDESDQLSETYMRQQTGDDDVLVKKVCPSYSE
jgi:hypothetical protein